MVDARDRARTPGAGELERLVRDPRNRRIRVAYHCREDPRVVVGRPWLGWTINFGHPHAVPAILFFVALALGPAALALLAVRTWPLERARIALGAVLVASIAAIIAVAVRLSRPPR